MFSLSTEYALRVITYLSIHPDTAAKNADIARVTQVPPGYLYKILQILDKAGLVRGRRGIRGGFMLNRPPSQITLFDVMEAVDPLPRVLSCPLRLESHDLRSCALHRRLDEAFALVEAMFRKAAISDILSDSSSPVPFCESPRTFVPLTRSAEERNFVI